MINIPIIVNNQKEYDSLTEYDKGRYDMAREISSALTYEIAIHESDIRRMQGRIAKWVSSKFRGISFDE